MIWTGLDLDKVTKKWLTSFLSENIDVFAWSTMNMIGIDPDVIVHRLNIDLTYHPVKQKKQGFALECRKAIIKRAKKMVKASFIRKVMYPDYLANVMLVKKAKRKW